MKVTYIHRHNKTGKVFYVGSGTLSRAYDKYHRSAEWKTLAAEGYTTHLIEQNVPRNQAVECEDLLIELVREMPDNILLNVGTSKENFKAWRSKGGKSTPIGIRSKLQTGKRWCNDGKIDKFCHEVPPGFTLGRLATRKDYLETRN